MKRTKTQKYKEHICFDLMGWKQNKNKSGSETNNESLNKIHNNTENKTNTKFLNKTKKLGYNELPVVTNR